MKKHLSALFGLCLLSFTVFSCAGNKANNETVVDGEVVVEEVVSCCKLDSTKTSHCDSVSEKHCDSTKVSTGEKSTCSKDSTCKKSTGCTDKK